MSVLLGGRVTPDDVGVPVDQVHVTSVIRLQPPSESKNDLIVDNL